MLITYIIGKGSKLWPCSGESFVRVIKNLTCKNEMIWSDTLIYLFVQLDLLISFIVASMWYLLCGIFYVVSSMWYLLCGIFIITFFFTYSDSLVSATYPAYVWQSATVPNNLSYVCGLRLSKCLRFCQNGNHAERLCVVLGLSFIRFHRRYFTLYSSQWSAIRECILPFHRTWPL